MKRLQITLRDNAEKEIIEVEEFDIQKFDEEMKTNDSPGITIGNQYFWKIDIRHLKELAEEEGTD